MDPKVPGPDEIIWLGEFWDEEREGEQEGDPPGSKGHRIVFRRAYRYLTAAQVVYEDWRRST